MLEVIISKNTHSSSWFPEKGWSVQGELPVNTYYCGNAIVNDELFILGGAIGLNTLSDYFYKINLLTKEVTHLTVPDTLEGRNKVSVTVYKNKIYAYGGYTPMVSTGYEGDLWCYDIATDSWTELTGHVETAFHTTILFGDKMLSFGGAVVDPLSGDPEYSDAIYQYDFETDTWSDFDSLPYPMIDLDVSLFGTDMLIVHEQNVFRRRIDGTWETYEGIIPLRVLHLSARVGDSIFIYGGNGFPREKSLLRMRITNDEPVVEIVVDEHPVNRYLHQVMSYRGCLLVLNGSVDSKTYKEILVYKPN